jgi:hypothetical protein
MLVVRSLFSSFHLASYHGIFGIRLYSADLDIHNIASICIDRLHVFHHHFQSWSQYVVTLGGRTFLRISAPERILAVISASIQERRLSIEGSHF